MTDLLVPKIPPAPRSPFPALVAAASVTLALAGCSAASEGSAAQSTTGAPSAGPEPVTVVEHAAAEHDGPLEISVEGRDGVQVSFRSITIAPGAGTGEHCHHGQLVAAVAAGELTHYADIYPGGVHVYRTGDSIIEGPGYRHEGRNEGAVDVVLWVTYLIPEGEPLAETNLSRCD